MIFILDLYETKAINKNHQSTQAKIKKCKYYESNHSKDASVWSVGRK